jgi:Asp-tRNA(Asn)/Glu-tRNA(Gln) amidotransferase A subunit family amidase
MGLTSRDGIVPLYLRNDIGGPMARTVEDAVRVLEVIAGYDPADEITARSRGKMPESYLTSLDPNGLSGARIGVFRTYLNPESTHPEIVSAMEGAIAELQAGGAEIVDPFDIPDLNLSESIWCEVFRHDVETYFESRGPEFPFKRLDEIIATGKYSDYIADDLKAAAAWTGAPCPDLYAHQPNTDFRKTVLNAMDGQKVDAFIYPTWSYPARLIGDMESPAGDNSQMLSPQSGLPAIQVPIGFTEGGLPIGMTFIGRLFDEPTLIRLSYSYEQRSKARRPPAMFSD